MAERDLDTDPYRPDEERVVVYLAEIAPNIGAGDDPIGFLIASHATLGARLSERCGALAVDGTPLPRTDLPVPDEPRVPRRPLGGNPMRPHAGASLSAREHPLGSSAMGSARNP